MSRTAAPGAPATVDATALRHRLDEGLAQLGGAAAALDEAARDRSVRFVVLLAKWNRVHNLTAVRDARAMIGRHLLDSLSLLPWIDGRDGVGNHPSGHEPDAFDLLDIGSGAGLPVLPLAIARPGLHCLSVESNNKRTGFQRQASLELGLSGVEVRQVRIETVSARARTVVSRAFAAPADFLAAAAPRCAPGGTALVMLGRAERLPEPLPAPFSLVTLHALEVPFESAERHLAVCRIGEETRRSGR